MITHQNTPEQSLIQSLSRRLDSVGVQTFNFSFYPEGPLCQTSFRLLAQKSLGGETNRT